MNPLYLYRNEEIEEYEVDQSTLTEKYTNEAIEFIKEHKDRPFFCYLAHTMLHIPLHVPEEFRGRSRGGTYGDTIECIDHYIEKIIECLKELDLEDNTLFIVTSDNGPWYEGSKSSLRGRKFGVYEGGIRMPFVAKWPGVIPENSVCSEMAHFMDMLPTFVRLAGGEICESIDGMDVTGLLTGEGKTPHEALYFYLLDNLNAMRYGKWKLHVAGAGEYGEDRHSRGMPQLFDMEADPGENYNLADRNPELVSMLTGMMEDFDENVYP